MTVVAGEDDITELDEELRDLCSAAVRRDQLDPFLERLEGWWFRRCLQQLAQTGSPGITGDDLDSFFTDLRDQFRPTNLPIDGDVHVLEPQLDDFHDKVFVHQLRFVSIGEKRISFAVRDYLRAFTQRSRWSRDGLLLVGELEKYEQRLIEEWELVFERMIEEVGTEAAEEEKLRVAKEIYAWVESADFHIRPECNEPFVTRGSYQLLSDNCRVGWHPDFIVRLAGLFEPASEGA